MRYVVRTGRGTPQEIEADAVSIELGEAVFRTNDGGEVARVKPEGWITIEPSDGTPVKV